jgi:hypothetical protein
MNREQKGETRRRFLATVVMIGSGAATASGLAAGERLFGVGLNGNDAAPAESLDQEPGETRRGMPPAPPQPADPQDTEKTEQGLDPQAVKKAQLRQTEKQIRDGVERLYGLAGELREEVRQTPSSQVLSVRTYKKMEEIERLAKQLKSKARG